MPVIKDMASPTARLQLYKGQEERVVLGFLQTQAHLTIGKGVRVDWLDQTARLMSLAIVRSLSYGVVVL